MRGRSSQLVAASMLFAVFILSACSPGRAVSTSGNSPGGSSAERVKAGEPVTGKKVTKDVPHSTESVSDMKDREAKEPLPPRGDVAIPSHRIRQPDNAAKCPLPPDAPAGIEKPGIPPSPGTGGY